MDVQTLQNRVKQGVPYPRKRRRKSVWRRTVWPVAQLCTLAVITYLVISSAVATIAHPIKLLNSEYRETQRLSGQLAALKAQNAELERRIKHLQSPQGAEQAARKLGYVKPGEITLVIPD